MVNIPKIVLKSQTRLTLNERFSQFQEQQEARMQMLKNDLRTRIVEESYQTGNHDSAELSEKLDRLTRDIDNPERLPAVLFPKKKSRPRESHRTRESHEVHEEPIVPAYRPLLYQSGKRSGGTRKHSRSQSRLVTYGDVLGSSDNGRAEVSHWKAEALRGGDFADLSSKNSQKYVNPLYRDSDDDTAESGGGSGGTSVHSRLGMKQGARPKSNLLKSRPNSSNYRRPAGNRGSKFTAGTSGSRQVVTKEDLDRELDEYRQKGIVMDVEMGED